jgi:predicted RNA-binding Zn-ribbon protein involved in translation (DUF1610 family)
MALQYPESMDECVYFTNRSIDSGKAMCWVFKGNCPKCKKGIMGKPLDEKTGRPKIRSKEYVCRECGHVEEKEAYEETLTANIAYTCPHCSHEGEVQVPFKRKTFKGVKAVVFQCESCNEKIPITKKMAEPKSKKKK